MAEKDYYKILGIGRNASKEEIKKAYKALAKKYHPDVSKETNAEEKFKEASEAFRVLADDKARAHFDKFGSADFSKMDASNFDFDFEGFDFDFGDLFEGFFGGGKRRSHRGADLQYHMEITLEEAAFGAEKKFTVEKKELCEKCDGTGAENKSGVTRCSECNGAGYIKRLQRTPFGISLSTTMPCRKCSGSGTIIEKPCKKCRGLGKLDVEKTINVKIPAGIETGSSIRMEGAGEPGMSGRHNGNLYVTFIIKQHDTFVREGNDLKCEVPISFVTAVLGGEIEVPILKGTAKLKIPAGTQSNTIFRMRGKGIPYLNRYAVGDQYVSVVVHVPENLTKKQRELLEEFEMEGGGKVEKRKGFFSRIKDAI
ncbi:MAG: molecular chaperone DnaJ [Nanoarchaeota archaeon]|nr:molecular chaperone DnaJ [Nanoarchaeota archaeon]